MGFRIHEESFDRVREEVVSLWRATRDRTVPLARFEWAYAANPDGPAVIWTIREETGNLAGFTVALPRRMLVDGKQHLAWQGADFTMHKSFRTLGPALKLRRAAREQVDAGRVDFFYSHHHSDPMVRISGTAGLHNVGEMVRFAKVLQAQSYARRLGKLRFLAPAANLANPILRVLSHEFRYTSSCAVKVVSEPRFDSRFDRLFEEVASARRVLVVRDARYLNWRYAQDPGFRPQAVLAEDGSRLLGYAMFAIVDDVAHLHDLLTADSGVMRDLVAAWIRYCRGRGLRSVSAIALHGNPILGVLEEFGFRPRPAAGQMFSYAPKDSPLADLLSGEKSWFMTHGDEDA